MENTIKMLPKYRVPVVEKKRNNKKKTHEEYVEELQIKNLNVIPIEEYINSSTKIKHECQIHKIIWEISPHNVLSGKGCYECGKEKYKKSRTKSHDEYVNEVNKIDKDIEVLERYINSETPILHLFKNCGHSIKVLPSNILAGKCCGICSGNKLKTHEEYVNELKNINPDLDVLEKYIDAKTSILHKCRRCGDISKKRPNNTLNGKGCFNCKRRVISDNQRKKHNVYILEIKRHNLDIEPLEEYINYNTPILHIHKKCGHKTKMRPSNVLNGSGCNICRPINARKRYIMSNEEYLERLKHANRKIVPIEEYSGMNKKIKHLDLSCNHVWLSTPYCVLHGGSCGICNKSKGEATIRNFLESKNIEYIYQHPFKDLLGVGGKMLLYDFFLPKYNLLIEFQGQQHEYPIEYWGGLKAFIRQKIHDRRKRIYCRKNNIKLLEIWYYEINKTEQILEQYLQYLNNQKTECEDITIVA